MGHEGPHFLLVHSAGLEPRGIHPLTIQVMHEVGISLEGHHSKPLGDFLGKLSVRYAIVVCEQAEKACPKIWPFTKRRLFWPFETPAAFEGTETEQLAKFREVRNQIDEQIQRWLASGSLS